MKLHLDDDELASCVACGLCLPHCPTYRVTGEEAASPRGRIAAMRAVHAGESPPDGHFVDFMERCVQCRACEAVCPSSVPFGHLMEGTRQSLADARPGRRLLLRSALWVLGHHRLLLLGTPLLAAAQRLHLLPRRLGLPRLPLGQRRLSPTGEDVVLFTGCVQDAWSRSTHRAAVRVLGAAGVGVSLPGRRGAVKAGGADCCGALHAHAGLVTDAVRLADQVMVDLAGTAPILVGSAGCGAALKGYGELVGTEAARAFSARVQDITEWLGANVDRLGRPPMAGTGDHRPLGRVAVQDPCHLRHVQRAHEHTRALLAPWAELVELDDEAMCCGAGGAYALFQPELAGAIRDRKVAAIARSGATRVASANPGCAWHLSAAGIAVFHPVELLDEALSLEPRRSPTGVTG